MRRCIVFAHYDRDGLIDDHVLYMLKSLREHAEQLIFVSVSATDEELKRLDDVCDVAISRENVGYDFVSWKTGLPHIKNLEELDEVLFINDSIYGPLSDISELFQKSDAFQCDFWGLTLSRQKTAHIQSFFFAFRKSLIDNGVFTQFWNTVEPLENKKEIIKRYEIGMTQFVMERGASCKWLFDQKDLTLWERLTAFKFNGRRRGRSLIGSIRWYVKNRTTNPTHVYWHSIINRGAPFIKVEFLRDNPLKLQMSEPYRFLENSDYDDNMVIRHLKRVKHPNK